MVNKGGRRHAKKGGIDPPNKREETCQKRRDSSTGTLVASHPTPLRHHECHGPIGAKRGTPVASCISCLASRASLLSLSHLPLSPDSLSVPPSPVFLPCFSLLSLSSASLPSLSHFHASPHPTSPPVVMRCVGTPEMLVSSGLPSRLDHNCHIHCL